MVDYVVSTFPWSPPNQVSASHMRAVFLLLWSRASTGRPSHQGGWTGVQLLLQDSVMCFWFAPYSVTAKVLTSPAGLDGEGHSSGCLFCWDPLCSLSLPAHQCGSFFTWTGNSNFCWLEWETLVILPHSSCHNFPDCWARDWESVSGYI